MKTCYLCTNEELTHQKMEEPKCESMTRIFLVEFASVWFPGVSQTSMSLVSPKPTVSNPIQFTLNLNMSSDDSANDSGFAVSITFELPRRYKAVIFGDVLNF